MSVIVHKAIILSLVVLPAVYGQTPVAQTASGTPLVAWRAFFHQVQYLQSASAGAGANEAGELQHWHEKHIGLTQQENTTLKQIAATHVAAIDSIETQAKAVIDAQRAKLAASPQRIAPAPELAAFQKQRDDLTASHIASLQSSLSSASWAKLDAWVKANFNQKVSRPVRPHPVNHPPAAQQAVQQ